MSRPPFDEDGYCEDGVYKEHYCQGCEGTRIKRLEEQLDVLREAAQEKINADIDCWDANNLHEHAISNKRNELAHDKLAALLQESDDG